MLLAFGHDLQREGGQIIVGSLLVLGSALSYALYLFGSGQVVARIGAVRLTAYASCVASVLVLLHFAVTHPLPLLWQAPAPVQWLSLVNATVCTVLPVLAIMLAVQRVGSSLAAQVGMLGPVSTIVMSLWLLDEPMGPAQIAGTVLVLIGVLLVTCLRRARGAGACAHPGGDPRDPGGAGDGLRPGGDARGPARACA